MSGYKRFVSYIFSYENGVKKENVGYARIENYNEQCRINIYMKDAVKRDQKASVYLFYRDEGKIQGIFMKEITITNGFGDCKIITESENIGGTNCSFENIGGIIVYVTANRFWGTEWDDKPIYGFEPEKELKAAVLEEVQLEEVQIEEKHYFEKDCFEDYTKVYPFYEQDKECIGVTPEDLETISPILGEWKNNDFLLYGYGRFRHIILLRKKDDASEYFIGVPGMYRPSEEKLAVTYGFSMFVPMRKEQAEDGDFGYWCTLVEMTSDC